MSTHRLILVLVLWLAAGHALASESGRSTYGSGSAADFGAGLVPQTGFVARIDIWRYDGSLSANPLNGAVGVEADLQSWVVTTRLMWGTGLEVAGARHAMYLSVPVAAAETEATLTLRRPAQAPVEQQLNGEQTGLGDVYLTPLALGWRKGHWNFKWLETLTIPSGNFDAGDSLNISRNYVALLSGLGATYRPVESGLELNARTGYIVSWENPETNYETGDEWFMDGSLAWRWSSGFTAGVAGYAIEQVTDDRGSGAVFGGLRGSVRAAGPVLRLMTTTGSRNLVWIAKWLHEFDAVDRFEGDTFMVSVVMRF